MVEKKSYFDFSVVQVKREEKIVLPLHEVSAKRFLDVDKVVMGLESQEGIFSRENPAKYIPKNESFLEQPLLKNIFQRMTNTVLKEIEPNIKTIQEQLLAQSEEENWQLLAKIALQAIRNHEFNPRVQYKLDSKTDIVITKFTDRGTQDMLQKVDIEGLTTLVDLIFADWANRTIYLDEEHKPLASIFKNKIPPFFLIYIAGQVSTLKTQFNSDYKPKFKGLSGIQTFEYWSMLFSARAREERAQFLDTETDLGYSTQLSSVPGKSRVNKLYKLRAQIRQDDRKQN